MLTKRIMACLDVRSDRGALLHTVKPTTASLFILFTIGGGIRTVESTAVGCTPTSAWARVKP